MPIVTAVKQLKDTEWVSVYLDGKPGFETDLESVIKHGVRPGAELTDKQVEKASKAGEARKVYENLLRFVTIRPRSKKEVESWFRRKKTPKSFQGILLQKLERLELLDDKKFAEWWVEQRLSFKPRGIKSLSTELYQKGIGKETIRSVLEKIEVDEVAIAKKLVEANEYKWKRFNAQKRKEKIYGFLARKGFGWEVIRKIEREVVQ